MVVADRPVIGVMREALDEETINLSDGDRTFRDGLRKELHPFT